ncbi:hypothetical protein [Bacillus sp. N1-1]|uniref:hypothetical protein n=1 Tax=Bacillus sp. N1-1 TaxID=2682541 RepID=UPI001317DC0B|nr:hypothetical protein [Bacillus sp. N1-1]QHA92004.1 hypothetical protein GNK04_11540 [Bacillus sp. N1-1]
MRRHQIGTAWSGKHVVLLHCSPFSNQTTALHKSLHAPTEPLHPSCTETLSIYLSIGYSIAYVHSLNDGTVEYVLTK